MKTNDPRLVDMASRVLRSMRCSQLQEVYTSKQPVTDRVTDLYVLGEALAPELSRDPITPELLTELEFSHSSPDLWLHNCGMVADRVGGTITAKWDEVLVYITTEGRLRTMLRVIQMT